MTGGGFAYTSSRVELDAHVAYGRVLERERIVSMLHDRYRFWSEMANNFDSPGLSSLYRKQADLFDAVIAWIEGGSLSEKGDTLDSSVADSDRSNEKKAPVTRIGDDGYCVTCGAVVTWAGLCLTCKPDFKELFGVGEEL